MSDEKNPEVAKTSDVAENAEVKNTVENVIADVEEVADQVVNYAEKSLSELTSLFDELMSDEARMKRIKEAEAIKAAFYKRLSKEKEAAGFSGDVEVPGEEISAVEQVAEESAAKAETDPEKVNPFEAIESGFKSLYNKFRKERAEYNRQLDEERAGNLVKKNAVVDELKALVEKQEDVSASFPEFRALQARWREIGPVPQTEFRNLNDTYQFYVEKFYDKVQINRDMRDLDFKKNLEAKEKF